MKKLRKTQVALNLPTLMLEGGLFLPDQLEKAAQGRASAQSEADYGTPKGVKLKDEYSRAFQIACAQWKHFAAWLERTDIDATALTHSFVQELLRDAFGYSHIQTCDGITLGERHYPIHFLAGHVPVVVAPHSLALHQPDTHFAVTGGGARKKSASMLLQELLNASADHLWGIACNGKTLRLLRDAATLTRPSFVDIDLADLLGGQRYAEFANVWRLLHASRAAGKPEECIWEKWRNEGQQEGTRVRDGLRLGVTDALLILGEGFLQHPANEALRSALRQGSLSKDAYFQQLLRLIYRLIFVFSVEERGLLHPKDDTKEAQAARRAYAEGYALGRLRDLCLKRRARNRYDDHWQALRIVFKGLESGEPRLALPALGGLFATNQCPTLDAASLSNAHLLAAMQHLRWASHAIGKSSGVLAPVDYRNMGPEELGSVYESLLELVPEIDLPARQFGFVGVTSEGSTAGNARKLSGSYYTPDALVQELIKSALDPVIEQRLAAQPESPTEALLAIRVIDPACGSGHFLLAAARRLAEKLAQLRADANGESGEHAEHDFRSALREVIATCIFGVDRNPMAVELARTALWLEGFAEGRPLGFLDHHLQVGDALLGLTDLKALELGIAKDAFKALSGDDKEVCKQLSKTNTAALKDLEKKRNSQQASFKLHDASQLTELQRLEALPENTTQQIAAKEAAYRAFLEEANTSRLAQAADLLVGAFLLPKTMPVRPEPVEGQPPAIPTSATLYLTLLGDTLPAEQQGALAAAQAACREARVLHWPLAFAQVFAQGGFDCVLGNPPWERIKLQEEEFFATRNRDIAAAKNKAERSQRIQWLSEGMLAQHLYPAAFDAPRPELIEGQNSQAAAEQRLYAEFLSARRSAEAASLFAHVKGDEGGRYPLTGVGDVNTYALFAETILQIQASSGRAGFIVPTGIATDDSTKAFFGHITQSGQLVSLYDIENREAVFPSVHRSYKFCLLTLGTAAAAQFVCFATQVSQLADPRRRFTLTPDEFRLINPNTLTCPVFRSERDAELTKKLYHAAPVLIDESKESGNPWGISFMAMMHMSGDSHLFQDAPAADALPLYEAKLIHQFDHRWATYTTDGNSRDVTLAEKSNPDFTVTPRYWVQAREVWLRVARLPDGLLKALKDGNAQAAALCVTQLLFGRYLAEQRRAHPGMGLYPAWKAFVAQHPYACAIVPTSLGFVGDNPPCLQPLNDDYLPAEGEARVQPYTPGASSATAWYATDPDAERAVLALAADYGHLPASEAPMADESDVLALAERWLQAACPQWVMGWRDITNATNERTVIASVVPLAGVGNKIPLFLLGDWVNAPQAAAFLANLSSLALDFAARQKIGGTTLNYFYLKQFPVLSPDYYTEADLAFIVPRVLELTYTAHDLKPWAQDLGYEGEPFPWDSSGSGHPALAPHQAIPGQDRRATLRAELDAYYARLYGLTEEELRYILDPADVMGDDYPSETFRVLKNKEQKEYGEYRTQRLVLAAWDKLETGELH